MRASLRTGLRSRFLAAIAAGSALATVGLGGGCGGSVESVPGASSGATGNGGSTSSSSGTTTTTNPTTTGGGSSSSSSGNVPTTPTKDASTPTQPVTCDWGKPQEACYTHDELEAQYYSPWRGGDVSDAAPPPWDKDGCLPKEDVRDGCCNVAVTGPTLTGTKCCYVHCTGGCCGRPFIVDGEARVARVVDREDWRTITGGPAHRIAVEALPEDARARIGRAWSNDAAMEHASVAAFARFTLDLLSVGAPPEILLDAQDATRDEIEHARACFTMASRYLGRAVGPDALDIGGGSARSLAEIAAATMKEGCIGETLSAELAEERARGAAHPYTRSVLDRIAEDEARHAELAWRFVGWAIRTGGETVRGAVARAIDESFANPPVAFDPALGGVDRETVRAHGLLDETTARDIVARSLREIVAPCAAATLGIRTDTRRAA